MRKYFLFILNILYAILVKSQDNAVCPPPPTSLQSSVLSFISVSPNNYRFIYKLTVECDQDPYNYPLYITDINSATQKIYPWILDSVRNATGVLDPCLVFPYPPCHRTFYYHADGDVQVYGLGAVAATHNCCRPFNAKNLYYEIPFAYGQMPCCLTSNCKSFVGPVANGIVNFIKMPALQGLQKNSSPQFTSNDTILFTCKDRSFHFTLHAVDPDHDSIAYHIAPARTFVIPIPSSQVKPDYFPFPVVGYRSGYSVDQPGGPNLTLDPVTGDLDATLHDTGTFVIPVSAVEYRKGVMLDSIAQDLLIKVFDCSQLPKPKASIPDSINNCNDFTVAFPNNSSPLYPAFNWNNTTFQWNFGDGDSSNLVYPSHTYTDTGSYDARIIIFPGLHCADTAFTKVLIYPYVNSSFTNNDSCSQQQVMFINTSSSSSGPIILTNWTIKKDSTTIFTSNQFNTGYTFAKAPQTYGVFLTVSNTKGCMSKDTQYINIYQSPYMLTTHDTILSVGATLQLQANDGNYNYNGQFSWWPAYGLSDPTIADPILNSTLDNTYYVNITNSFGCSLQDSIHVKYYSGPEIYVPNAFTPNGDGRNDIFRPIPVGISVFKYFRVFNRYGQLMFQTTQPKQGWDGTYNGGPALQGTYVWEVDGIDYQGKTISKKGTVILLR